MKMIPMVEFALAEPKDELGLVDCIQKTFPAPHGEVMACQLGLQASDYLAYTEKVSKKAIEDRCSFVAKDGEGRVVGFCISEDLYTAPRYSAEAFSEKFLPLLAILEDLDARYLSERRISKREVFHLYMLGVLPEYANSGLGRKLIAGALHFATETGYKSAIAEATGVASQSICKRLGFEVRAAVPYKSFLYKGKKVFSTISQPEECVLVEKNLRIES